MPWKSSVRVLKFLFGSICLVSRLRIPPNAIITALMQNTGKSPTADAMKPNNAGEKPDGRPSAPSAGPYSKKTIREAAQVIASSNVITKVRYKDTLISL